MRVGILTSGGDCQALNATMRGLVKALYQQRKDIEIIGFLKGYQGLMYEKYKKMSLSDFEDILNVGGTILGSSRCPFKKMRVIEDGFDKVEAMKKTYKKLKLDCLVVLGGNGSLKSANMLSQEGLNVIGLPKTIDNDTWGTDYTFGFQSAVDIATNYLNEIETTAKSHSRVFVVEIMGHKVGHICLQAGIAAGVDAILLPEIPYDIKVIAKKIKENQKTGKELMSRDELAVMDGSKCILQLRGVRPFFSDKFDITKHKRYKELSDYDKKNEFDVEAYMRHRMEVKLTRTQEFDLYEFSEESLAGELNTENKEAGHVKDLDT